MCERGKQVEMSPTRHILVVEDEKAVRERMAKILQFEGYAVDAAQDVGGGADAGRRLLVHGEDGACAPDGTHSVGTVTPSRVLAPWADGSSEEPLVALCGVHGVHGV